MFHQRYDPLFPRLKQKHGNSKILQKYTSKHHLEIKFTDNFETSKPRPYVFASKVNKNNKIIFQPSFYFFILQKCWNNKIVRRPLFKGDDKIPAKLVRLMILVSGDNSHQKLWDKFFQNYPQGVARTHFWLPVFSSFSCCNVSPVLHLGFNLLKRWKCL